MTPSEIRQWRHDNNFSPAELAKALDVSRNTIYRWENGAMDPMGNLAEKLIEALARREVEKDEAPQFTRIDPDVFAVELEQPHGSLIGFKRHFWMEWTDAQRHGWIISADNPLTALPWPWWSHGWEWYPPRPRGRGKDKVMPEKQAHYMLKSGVEALRKQIAISPGVSENNKLRGAVIYLCQRDFPQWLTPTGSAPIDLHSYLKMRKIMEGENPT